MKLKYVILFAILLIACTPSNHASDSQINWCYGAYESISSEGFFAATASDGNKYKLPTHPSIIHLLSDENKDIHALFYSALKKYKNDTGLKLEEIEFIAGLLKENENSLIVCKIWADMSNED